MAEFHRNLLACGVIQRAVVVMQGTAEHGCRVSRQLRIALAGIGGTQLMKSLQAMSMQYLTRRTHDPMNEVCIVLIASQ